MSTVSLRELQQDPEGLVDRLVAGERFVLIHGGRAIAEIKPLTPGQAGLRPFGLCAGFFTVPDDFDAPLPQDLLRDLEGR